jgi:hypothetical protein
MEARQCLGWKETANHSFTYNIYWALWKSLAVKDGILECHWDSTNRQYKIAQTVIPQSKVKDILAKLDRGPSGGYLGVIMTLDKVR